MNNTVSTKIVQRIVRRIVQFQRAKDAALQKLTGHFWKLKLLDLNAILLYYQSSFYYLTADI